MCNFDVENNMNLIEFELGRIYVEDYYIIRDMQAGNLAP